MTNKPPFRVSNSLTDFSPLFFDLEYHFQHLKGTDIDGVEIVTGVKSRWDAKRMLNLSQKYEIPIISLHQPVWAGLGLWFDEGFATFAKKIGVKSITCHPIQFLSFDHPRMQKYLARLSNLQEKYDVEILLENQPGNLFGLKTDTYDIEKLIQVVKNYGLKITLDIDHLGLVAPHQEPWFVKLLPYLRNIHLSSFTKKQHHLPLYLGNFQAKDFIEALYKVDYNGLLTFEIHFPRLTTFFNYNFEMIKKSVELVKSI